MIAECNSYWQNITCTGGRLSWHVGFRAHVKIASRIVSYDLYWQNMIYTGLLSHLLAEYAANQKCSAVLLCSADTIYPQNWLLYSPVVAMTFCLSVRLKYRTCDKTACVKKQVCGKENPVFRITLDNKFFGELQSILAYFNVVYNGHKRTKELFSRQMPVRL